MPNALGLLSFFNFNLKFNRNLNYLIVALVTLFGVNIFQGAVTNELSNTCYDSLETPSNLYYETSELNPSDDAYLEGSNRYDSDILRLQEGFRTSYLKFDMNGIAGDISAVELQLTIFSDSDSGNGTVTVYNGSSSSWTELDLSSSNAPSTNQVLASQSSGGSGTHTYNLSITDQEIFAGILTLVLKHQGSDDLSYASKEHATVSIRPKLIVTTTTAASPSNCPDTISNESSSVVITRQEPGSWPGAKTIVGVSDNTNGSPCALKLQKDETGSTYGGYKIIVNLGENNIAAGDRITIGLDGNGVSGNARLKVVSGVNNTVNLINHSYEEGQGWSSLTEEVVIPSGSSQLVLWLYPNIGSADLGYSLFDNLIIAKEGSSGGGDTPVAGISLNTSSISLQPGGTSQLTASISPNNATNQTVSWSSSNTTVASVNTNGLVTAVAEGNATITVTTQDGNRTASSAVTVSDSSTPPSGGGNETGLWSSNSNGLHYTGNVGIGTTPQSNYQLAVDGKIHTKEVKVDLTGWADYVFFKDYKLPTLEEVQQHIQEKGHLINIPSATEVEANGIELGQMNKLLLEKIEELTLYTLQQQKEINFLKKAINSKK